MSSSLRQVRQEIKDALVAQGLWSADEVIIQRQTDLWNAVATAIEASRGGACVWIGVARGRNRSESTKHVDLELTIPITTFASIQVDEDSDPEEAAWEAMVKFLHGWRADDGTGRPKHVMYALALQSFEDREVSADGRVAWIARESIFQIKHVIPTNTTP